MTVPAPRITQRDVADRSKIGVSRAADLRYVGQEHSVTVDLPAELFVKRDRVGIKPLYYHDDGSRLIFASEIRPLLAITRHSLPVLSATGPVSSVRYGSVSRIRPGQAAEVIASGIPSAASMCYDSVQNQLVIPMNQNNALAFIPLN